MKYATPELVVVGAASDLVQGVIGGKFDSLQSTNSHPELGIVLGLDD